MTLHIRPTSPYLTKPLRTEAQARQDKLDRIARDLVDRARHSCTKLVNGQGGGDWVLASFLWMWNYGGDAEHML